MNENINNSLTPSLWRTCRALANMRRLQLFKAMLDKPPQAVCSLARSCNLPMSICSFYLRQMNARGLCKATRRSRWVFYHLQTDPMVRHSRSIEQAVASALRHATPQVYKEVFADLTAYTHPRRIAIVHILSSQKRKGVDFCGLCSQCHISLPALKRHLAKLERRGVVFVHGEKASLARPCSSLARTLLAIAAATPLEMP